MCGEIVQVVDVTNHVWRVHLLSFCCRKASRHDVPGQAEQRSALRVLTGHQEEWQAHACLPAKGCGHCIVFAVLTRAVANTVRAMANQLAAGKANELDVARTTRASVTGLGPRAALAKAKLGEMAPECRKCWIEDARLSALLGDNLSTRKSLKSGVCCYVAFVGATHCLSARV